MFFFAILFSVFFALKIFIYYNNIILFEDNPFECGVVSNKSSHKPYSLPFFLITLIFLLFDIEIVLILPFLYSFYECSVYVNLCILILTLGLLLEWKFQSLQWSTHNL